MYNQNFGKSKLYKTQCYAGAYISCTTTLALFLRTISAYTGDDINECSTGPNNCQQVCVNTEGSFTCGCEAGYLLDSDRSSCSGINL